MNKIKESNMNSNQIYMNQAIKKAWQYQLRTYPNPAVGCLVLYQGEIVALEAHQKAGTSHAEVLALLQAYESISGQKITFDRFDANQAHAFLYTLPEGFFGECRIFVTLEPCSHIGQTPSCASLLAHLKPQKVLIATHDPIKGHDGGLKRLLEQGIEVEIGISQKEALDLLEPFLIWQKRAFVLFKVAQTSNGKIGGGYLSSQASLIHVHQLRGVCSRMVIGGNTVRVDRPTLDCRFTGEEAPDIVIYSKEGYFDREIPLFGIEGREVMVTDKLEIFDEPSFILVEGGEGMLNALKDKIDWLLQYQTPKLSSHSSSYDLDLDLTFLMIEPTEVDCRVWSRVS
jgi:diaminohydroxyphosphoribosylaminopyrimidine deaminase/5-amino-6-(5-phosphoribosylamino)uracil reductase